jgi:hypothetical protein
MLRLCGLAFEARNYDDGALLTLLRIRDELRESPRWVVTFNNCWEDDNPDYVIEWFGIEVGETEDIESYPYYRLKAAARDNQKMLIPLAHADMSCANHARLSRVSGNHQSRFSLLRCRYSRARPSLKYKST